MEDVSDADFVASDAIDDPVAEAAGDGNPQRSLRDRLAELRKVAEQVAGALDLGHHPLRGGRILFGDVGADGAEAGERPGREAQISHAGGERRADFVIFIQDQSTQDCLVVELKDGDQFDTKKSRGEWDTLQEFIHDVGHKIMFNMSRHVCFFHARKRQEVVEGFKRVLSPKDALTGQEFCDIIGVDYESIIEKRQADQALNLKYFLDKIVEDELLQGELLKRLEDDAD